MNRLCCPPCRLRLTPVASAHLTACPECGRPLASLPDGASVFGFRLFDPADDPYTLPVAVAVAVAIPVIEPPIGGR